jgi:hypothetical protein
MSRPLPRCARCGDSLANSERVLLRWCHNRGVPEVGWHLRCADADPLYEKMVGMLCGDPLRVLGEIEQRGEGRMLRYWRHADSA